MAAVDIFLKLDGIPGESVDDKHRDEIDLMSFSWGESNTGAHAAAGGAAAGKVSMQDIHFTTKVSKATPALMLHCANGSHIKTGVITFRKTVEQKEGNGFEFLFYKFDTIVITSVEEAGDNSDVPTDSVSFAFAKIDVMYKEQTAAGGTGGTFEFAWDLAANKKI